MSRASDNIVISPTKILRDLVILVPLLLVAGYGIEQSGWLEPPAAPGEAAISSAVETAPAGTNPEVLAVLAYLNREDATPVANIDGLEFSWGDFDTRAATLITRLNQPMQSNVKPEIQADILRVRVFYDITKEVALDKAIASRGLVPSDAEVETRLAAIEESFGSRDELYSQLAQMGTDFEGMRNLTRENIAAEELRSTVLNEAGIDPEGELAAAAWENWQTEEVQKLPVEILDPAFQESMQTILELFQAAPQHAAPGMGAGGPGHTHSHGPGDGHDHSHDHDHGFGDAPGKEDGPMDTERHH